MLSHLSPQIIEGRHNSVVKLLRRMARSGEFFSDGLVLLETVRLIEDALRSGIEVPSVFLRRGAGAQARNLLEKLSTGTSVYELSSDIFDTIANTETSQGVLALASVPQWKEQDLFPGNSALVPVVVGVQDPGNLGAIIRTAEAFGATGIILSEATVSPYNAKAIRATAGSLLRLPMLRNVSLANVVALLSRRNIQLFTTVVKEGKQLSAVRFSRPTAIAIGSEGAGLPEALAEAGEKLTIPIAPSVESLNVAAAAAVVLYEIARQRESQERRKLEVRS